ncbi:unnamed protein product [Symbiodinium microadriaticum]|nr:unnamed protein product [Symbiodinium microadriaticum]
MTRKHVTADKDEEANPKSEVWSSQWVWTLSVLIFVVAFALSGQILPRFVPTQCTSEQGMCTPGACTCPFPLMKRDLVTQDALACSQCVEEFCPAVPGGTETCTESACECEDPSWPRIDVGSPGRPCWQCVHPHVDMTLRSVGVEETCLRAIEGDDGMQLASSNSSSCTVFRFDGVSILVKEHNTSCLAWADEWKLFPCKSESIKFAQRTLSKDEVGLKDMYCAARGKNLCVQAVEYMCTTDPAQCSTGPCRCENSSHLRKEMQTVNRSVCHVCAPPQPSCSMFPDSCSAGPCECHTGFVKVKRDDDCFSCRPGTTPPTGLASFLSFASAVLTFLCCVALGVAVGCAIRRFFVGDISASVRRRRRNAAPRTWSERWALRLEEVFEAVCEMARSWKPLRSASTAVCNFLDMCDDAMDPVYTLFENALDVAQNAIATATQDRCGRRAAVEPFSKQNPRKEKESHRQKAATRHSASQNALPGKDLSLAAGNLSWDPLHAMHEENGSSKVSPKEWMNGFVPGLAAQRDAARATKTSPAATSAVQRLRQRREAKATAAAKAAQQAVQPPAEEEPQVDESWIDAMERREAKEKEAKERAAAQRRERKHAARARRSRNGHEGAAEDCDQIEHTERDTIQVAGESESAQAKLQQAGEDEGEMTNLQDELLVCEDGEDSGEMISPQEELLLSEDRKFIDDEVDASSQASDGWIKSSTQKVRNTRRRGDIQGEQEPAAEPDPQHEECNRLEPDGKKQSDTEKIEPQTSQDAASGLSKRQRQRLRQRQAVEDARASGRKTERVEVRSKKKAEVEVPPHSTADVATASAAPPTSAEEAQETIAPEAEVPVQKGKESKEDGSQGLVPSFADIVAGRPPRPPGEEPRELEASAALQFAADAPDFVPLAAMTEMPFQVMTASAYSALWAQAGLASSTRKARRGRKARREGDDLQALPLTTVVISEIPEHYTAESFRLLLDGWGLGYNFFYMPPERQEEYGQCAIVNFVDPSCVMVCQCVFQAASEGIVSLFPIQGLENNVAYWTQAVVTEDMVNGPLVFPGAAAHWSFDSAGLLNSKFSPQIREQFHKTKLCVFNRNQKCSMGALCPFAHSEEELQKAPDLKKTKLCYNFFRRKCNDANCKFAHGYAELRATDTVFKTELCRWWANGSCKAGASCRYAHGLKELRSNPTSAGLLAAPQEFPEAEDFRFEHYGFGDPMGLDASCGEEDATAFMRMGSEETSEAMQQDRSASESDPEFEASNLLGPRRGGLQRQQTAPPTAAFSKDDDNIMLRIKGTFMEAVRIDEDIPQVSMHRSWSDGDLAQLCEAIESESEAESE